jgi:hypothetical protein
MQSDVVVDVVAVILRLCLGISCGEHCVCLDQSFVSANATIVAVLVFCGLLRLNFNFAIHRISQFFFFFFGPYASDLFVFCCTLFTVFNSPADALCRLCFLQFLCSISRR